MTHAKKIAAFVAMGLLMAVSTASAQQKKSSITSGGEITFKTQTTDQGEFGPTGAVSSKFTEYRTMPNGTSIPSLNLWSTGGHVQFRLFANNIQQRDQRYQGDVKAHGMKLKFDVNSISHDMGADARTIFNRTGTGLWEMDKNQRLAIQNAVDAPGSGATSTANFVRFLPYYQQLLAPTFAAADRFDLNGQRRTSNVELNLGKRLPVDVTLSLKNEMKKGYRGEAGINENFRISPALEVGGPLDETVNDLGIKVAKQFSMGNAYVSFNRNQYLNSAETLQIDYPFQSADMPVGAAQTPASATAIGATGGPSRERAVMAPDNAANTLAAGFRLKFKRQTRVDVGFSSSERTQNAKFYGYTLYTALATAPTAMPATSLDGKSNSTMFNISFSSKPVDHLTVRAAYRKYDLEDKTSRFVVPGGVYGTSFSTAPAAAAESPFGYATNTPYDTKSAKLSASATYNFKALTVEGSFSNTELERTNREAEKGKDQGMGLTALYHFNDFLGFRGIYTKTTRTAEGSTVYGYQADEAPFTNTRLGGDLELSLPHGLEVSLGYIKRKVDYTDRPNRCNVVSNACAATTALVTPLPDSPSGLLGTSYDSYTGQIDWTVNERVELGAYMTYEKDAQTNQWSSNPSTTTYNLVKYAGTDKTNTYGGHAMFTLIPEKATLMVNGSSQKVDGFMDITAPNQLGSFNTQRAGFSTPGAIDVPGWDGTEITTLNAQLNYSVTKAWGLGAGYTFEKYDYKDPFTVINNELLPVSTIIFMKQNDGKYQANVMYVKMTYKF